MEKNAKKEDTKRECIDLSSSPSSVNVNSRRLNEHIMECMGNKTFVTGDLTICFDIASKLGESCFIYISDIDAIQ